jgi:hypothetical protein
MWGWGDYSLLEAADITLGVEETEDYDIEQDVISLLLSPNPFSGTTHIMFSVGSKQYAASSIEIYDATGQAVKSFGSLPHAPSSMQIIWEGDDYRGQTVSAGVYFVQLTAGDNTLVKKAILLK